MRHQMHSGLGLRAIALGAVAAVTVFGTALAGQVEVSSPPSVTVPESRFGVVTLKFEIVDTGAPKFEAVTLGPITEVVDPISGDTMFDILTASAGAVSGCTDPLGVGASCMVTADFIVLDGDPFDLHSTAVDTGKWFADIRVPWKSTFADADGKFDSGVTFGADIVSVADDFVSVPEPAAWALMVGGFAMMAAALRHRGARRPVSPSLTGR